MKSLVESGSAVENQPRTCEGRMIGRTGKIRAGDKKSGVTMRRKRDEMLDFQRIDALCLGLSDRNVG